jgi:hypothetical protein
MFRAGEKKIANLDLPKLLHFASLAMHKAMD